LELEAKLEFLIMGINNIFGESAQCDMKRYD